ncbi:hypothetical protein, partial [Pseudosulfitobacter pseudonitzschiae]|uniref:hypothetical protein n=1 Tax=Pseudosulfitobacter pseudonitzschiae TaxID=1402135 RepID=UPI001B80B5A8
INCRPPDKEHGLSCDPPHPIPPLPRHLVDQTTRFHPSKVALDGSPAGADQGVAIALSFHQKVLKRFQQDEAEIDVEYYVAISIFISHFNKREN